MASAETRVRALLALARARKAAPAPDTPTITGAPWTVPVVAPEHEPPQPGPPAERAVLTALAVYFASRAAIGASRLPDHLISALTALGISRRAAHTAGRMALSAPMPGRTRHGMPLNPTGSLSRQVRAEEPALRARYVLAAARRLTQAFTDNRVTTATQDEKRWLDAHAQAGRQRRRAALTIDALGQRHSMLRWRTAGDAKVEPECAVMEGVLFPPDKPPGGKIPGAVHPRCRCTAVPAFPNNNPAG